MRFCWKRNVTSAVSLLASGVLVVSAGEVPQSAGKTPQSLGNVPETSLWDTFNVYGDLRLRYELDYDSVRADGKTPRDDRNRLRTRARLGVKFSPVDWFTANLRLRYGDSNSQQSPHVTLLQDGGPIGDHSDVWLDRLSIGFQTDDLWLKIGRTGLPFWKPHEMYWDDDIFLDGGSLGLEAKAGDTQFNLAAGAWALPDGPDDHRLSERSLLSAGQIKLAHDMGNQGQLIIADSLLLIRDDSSVVNVTNDDIDYTVNALDLQYKRHVRDTQVTLGATYLHNFDHGPNADPTRNDTDGFVIYGSVGRLEEKGDWLVAYYYADIEKYAVARYFAEDDWSRFGSATQTRSSDFRGHELRLGYMLADNLNIILRAYHVETKSTREDGNRIRLDLNYRF